MERRSIDTTIPKAKRPKLVPQAMKVSDITNHPSHRMDFNETITVLVGKEKAKYTLHKSYATRKSVFIQTATSGKWVEATTQQVELPETKTARFEQYIHWLYEKEVLLESTSGFEYIKDVAIVLSQEQLLELYVLGYFLMDTSFRNDVVERLSNMSRSRK